MSDEQNNGNADVTGDQDQNQGTNGNAPDKGEKTVPYARFAQVNEAKKAAEETLQAVVEDLKAELPEDFQDLVPNLPPAEQLRWIRQAQKKGLFGGEAPTSGPDSKRPGGKSDVNFDGMSPHELIALGMKKQK